MCVLDRRGGNWQGLLVSENVVCLFIGLLMN